MGDNPQEYENLTPEEKEAVQYWISRAIAPANQKNEYSSYGLKHDYERESMQYLTNGQFKGAMLAAGYAPTDLNAQNWTFLIKPTYDRRTLSVAFRNHEEGKYPTFRINADGKPDMGLARHAALIRRAREDTRNGYTGIRDEWHTRQGELIYPTVPYTYENLVAAFNALASVDALKAVKRVMDEEPLYTTMPDGKRHWLVPYEVVDTLVKADILESTNGQYHLHKHISTEALKIVYDWLGHTKELSVENLPPREEWPNVDDVLQKAKDTVKDAGYEPPPGIEP